MADTFGDLIDKLTIANIRLWHLEDSRRDHCNNVKLLDQEQLNELLIKVNQTNRERNNLIDQINASRRVLIDKTKDKNTNFVLSVDDLLGNGKNKFYKGEDT